MSEQYSSDTTDEDEEEFFMAPLNQPPSNQNNANANVNATSNNSSNDQEHDTTDEEDDSYQDYTEEEEIFPEKPWARRCVKRMMKEYKPLHNRWRQLQSGVEVDDTDSKNKLDQFETEEVLPFVKRELLFFTELVVQAYIKDALAIVGVWSENPALRPVGASRLPQAVLEGRRGLCWHTFHTLLNSGDEGATRDQQPTITCPRAKPVRNKKKGILNLAGRYKKKDVELPRWGEKLQELFFIDDDEIDDPAKRKEVRVWDEKPTFRKKTRRLIQFLKSSFRDDNRLANFWKQNLAQMASRYLWAVPYFDKTSYGKPPEDANRQGYQTIMIIVPATYRVGLQQTRDRIRQRERALRKHVKEWLERQPKVEDGGDGNDRKDVILAAIKSEKSMIEALRSVPDPIDHETRKVLIKEARTLFCNSSRLLKDLQCEASLNLKDDFWPNYKIRLNPMLDFNSKRGASTIGLEGRNRGSMVRHIRALHPTLSESEANRVVERLVNHIKNEVPDFHYVEKGHKPIVYISPRDGRVDDCDPKGVPLFAAFGDALHLTTIDEYMASLSIRQQPGQDDSDLQAGQSAAKRRRISRGGSNRGESIISIGTTVGDGETRTEVVRTGSDLGVETTRVEMEDEEESVDKGQQTSQEQSLSGLEFDN